MGSSWERWILLKRDFRKCAGYMDMRKAAENPVRSQRGAAAREGAPLHSKATLLRWYRQAGQLT